MSFKQRKLDFQFNLGVDKSTGKQKSFAEGGNQVYLSGLRANVQVVQAGDLSMGSATVQIFGMTLSLMNQLSTLGLDIKIIGPNFLTILAGDDDGMAMVFQGSIVNAWMDGNSMPNVPFQVEAATGLAQAIAVSPPKSYPTGPAAQDVLAVLASEMNLVFENNGVAVQLPPGTYFHGSARNQAYACKAMAGIEMVLDNNTLAIWPVGKSRTSQRVVDISPERGMKGYPTYTSKGIEVETLYNPAVKFGATINVQNSKKADGTSVLPPADGKWTVFGLEHNLESQTPHGSWFSVVRASPVGSVVGRGLVAPLPR